MGRILFSLATRIGWRHRSKVGWCSIAVTGSKPRVNGEWCVSVYPLPPDLPILHRSIANDARAWGGERGEGTCWSRSLQLGPIQQEVSIIQPMLCIDNPRGPFCAIQSAAKAKEKIYGSGRIAAVGFRPWWHQGSPRRCQSRRQLPDHALLRQAAAALPPAAEFILVIMPSHASEWLNRLHAGGTLRGRTSAARP